MKYQIYHIIGIKIGCTCNSVINRIKAQMNSLNLNALPDFEILEEHENDKIAGIRERELQLEYGYRPDRRLYSYSDTTNKKRSETKRFNAEMRTLLFGKNHKQRVR